MKDKVKEISAVSTGNVDDGQPTTLDQVWGNDGYSIYGESTLEEYEANISALNKTDLYSHAAKRGIIPVGQRHLLIKKLKNEYVKYHNSFVKAPKVKAKSKDIPQNVLNILSEGR